MQLFKFDFRFAAIIEMRRLFLVAVAVRVGGLDMDGLIDMM